MRCSIALVLPWAIGACTDPSTAPQRAGTRVDTSWVTANVYSHVDPHTGLFRLDLPAGRFLTLAAAESLAVADARLLGSPSLIGNLPASLEQEHGGAIAFESLEPCQRSTYAASPYTDFPPSVPEALRRNYGPHWAIPLCEGGGPAEISVGLPDASPAVHIVDGQLVFDQGQSEDLTDWGIPARFPSGLPLTPEDAVKAVYHTMQVKTSAVPTAYKQGPYLPMCASWRVALERATPVRDITTGETSLTTELFVRRTPACESDTVAFYVPQSLQPEAAWVLFPKDITAQGNQLVLDSALVTLGGPVFFRRVNSGR